MCVPCARSIAIGFIFEMDEMLYQLALGDARRHTYEHTLETRHPLYSPLASHHTREAAKLYSWAMIIFDVS